MIFVRNLVGAIIVALANWLGFKYSPSAFYTRKRWLLERIFVAYSNNRGRVMLIKPGFYFFNSDDLVIYSHNRVQSIRAKLISTKWAKVGKIREKTRRLIGFSVDDNVSFLDFLRDDYLSDPSLNLNSYVTLIECTEFDGPLVEEVLGDIRFRYTLLAFSPE